MPRDEKRRQRSLQKHAAKRKQKHKALHSQGQVPVVGPSMRVASMWPVHECVMTKDWDKPGEIVQIIVSRRGPLDEYAVGTFIVDLGCLGIKDANSYVAASKYEYERSPASHMKQLQPMKKVDLDLAAKVIRESIAYARQFGFKPHPDYFRAAPLLEGARPDDARERVPLGIDGKPTYFVGPYDNVNRNIAKLTQAVGPEGFHFTGPLDALPASLTGLSGPLFIDDLIDEDDDDDWDPDDENAIDV